MIHINLRSKYPQQYNKLRPFSHIRLHNLLLIVLLSQNQRLRFNQLNINLQIFIKHLLESALGQRWRFVDTIGVVAFIGGFEATFEHFFMGARHLLDVVEVVFGEFGVDVEHCF